MMFYKKELSLWGLQFRIPGRDIPIKGKNQPSRQTYQTAADVIQAIYAGTFKEQLPLCRAANVSEKS